MVELVIPNTFATRIGTANLVELDENFNYLLNNISTAGYSGGILDGGTPSTTYLMQPKIDCGGVT